MPHTSCVRMIAVTLVLAFGFTSPTVAQQQEPAAAGANAGPDGAPTPPGRGGDGNSEGNGNGSVGLPDAVTVLNILRGLPRPGGGDGNSDTPDNAPPDGDRPRPQVDPVPPPGGGLPPPRPPRSVAIPPDQPFTPRPLPRPLGAPPAAIAAVVPETRDREVIVTLSAGSDANTVFELAQDLGLDGETLYTSQLLNARVVRFLIPDTRSVADVLQQLSTDARVIEAQPSFVYEASGAATDAGLPVPQYAPAILNLDAAHRIAQGKRVVVAVIDTAVDASHPALKGAVSGTYDALGGSKIIADVHGTAIAGILGARANLTGVAPLSSVLGIRAFEASSGGAPQSTTLALLKSLDFAAASGARVINMSFAGPEDPLLGKAIAAAVKRGIVAVAAAGNGGPDAKPAYPAAFADVIAVTATDSGDATFKSANHGSYIAVAAPGVDIISAAPNGAYDIASGTSMAAAHVSGIAALLLEKNPKLSPAGVRDAIAQSARKEPGRPADELGAGIADAAAAVERVK